MILFNVSSRKLLAVALCFACLAFGQQTNIAPVRPSAPILWRPYLPVDVPPVRLGNSDRLRGLIRAGQLYLTAQDAIALAIENNIDLEIARYNEPDLEWRYERFQAGGALPGVTSGASQASSVANGQGVLGSQAAAGVSISGSGGGARGTANATVSQVGPVTANLDPSFQIAATYTHRTSPQPDPVLSIIPVLIQGQRVYTSAYQQGFLFGGGVNINYNDHYLNENAPSDYLNPSVAPAVSISIQQNLLQGLGVAVNKRNITVAKMNLQMSDLNFRGTVSSIVTNVLNVYYSLSVQDDDVKAKQDAVNTAQRFYDENRQRFDLGAIAQLDVITAQNQISVAQQNLVNSQSALMQQELQLKNLISRPGLGDPLIAETHIVPLDHIAVPATDDFPSLKDLIARAVAHRPDLLAEQQNVKTAEISALGTINGLLPSAQVFSTLTNAGLAGTPRRTGTSTIFNGGIGTALGQIARRDFPSETIGVFGSLQIYDRQAQADYAIDQLQLRQQQLTTSKDLNQAQVDVTNAVVALRQARARYEADVQNRILSQQLLDAEQKRFSLGASTSYNVVQQERDLAAAQASELSAEASWESARLYLDSVTGATLENNHVSLDEAKSGKVIRTSEPPAVP